MHFRLSAAAKTEPEEKEEAAKPVVGKALLCRLCKGSHFTAKCPYKDQLQGLDAAEMEDDPAEAAGGRGASGSGGKYVPP